MKIEFLKLFTSNIEAQEHFYSEVLGLAGVKNFRKYNFGLKQVFQLLNLKQSTTATPYHVAFHIPALSEEKALKWLKIAS